MRTAITTISGCIVSSIAAHALREGRVRELYPLYRHYLLELRVKLVRECPENQLVDNLLRVNLGYEFPAQLLGLFVQACPLHRRSLPLGNHDNLHLHGPAVLGAEILHDHHFLRPAPHEPPYKIVLDEVPHRLGVRLVAADALHAEDELDVLLLGLVGEVPSADVDYPADDHLGLLRDGFADFAPLELLRGDDCVPHLLLPLVRGLLPRLRLCRLLLACCLLGLLILNNRRHFHSPFYFTSPDLLVGRERPVFALWLDRPGFEIN